MTKGQQAGERGEVAARQTERCRGETARKRLGIPMVGMVRSHRNDPPCRMARRRQPRPSSAPNSSTSRTRSGSGQRPTRLARDASPFSCISAVSSFPMAPATRRVRRAPDATPPPIASPAADVHHPTTGARRCRLGGRLTAPRRCRLRAAAGACRSRPPSAAPGRRAG